MNLALKSWTTPRCVKFSTSTPFLHLSFHFLSSWAQFLQPPCNHYLTAARPSTKPPKKCSRMLNLCISAIFHRRKIQIWRERIKVHHSIRKTISKGLLLSSMSLSWEGISCCKTQPWAHPRHHTQKNPRENPHFKILLNKQKFPSNFLIFKILSVFICLFVSLALLLLANNYSYGQFVLVL